MNLIEVVSNLEIDSFLKLKDAVFLNHICFTASFLAKNI